MMRWRIHPSGPTTEVRAVRDAALDIAESSLLFLSLQSGKHPPARESRILLTSCRAIYLGSLVNGIGVSREVNDRIRWQVDVSHIPGYILSCRKWRVGVITVFGVAASSGFPLTADQRYSAIAHLLVQLSVNSSGLGITEQQPVAQTDVATVSQLVTRAPVEHTARSQLRDASAVFAAEVAHTNCDDPVSLRRLRADDPGGTDPPCRAPPRYGRAWTRSVPQS
jgi:hypothetical protein